MQCVSRGNSNYTCDSNKRSSPASDNVYCTQRVDEKKNDKCLCPKCTGLGNVVKRFIQQMNQSQVLLTERWQCYQLKHGLHTQSNTSNCQKIPGFYQSNSSLKQLIRVWLGFSLKTGKVKRRALCTLSIMKLIISWVVESACPRSEKIIITAGEEEEEEEACPVNSDSLCRSVCSFYIMCTLKEWEEEKGRGVS